MEQPILTGRLLVATPVLDDPNFRRSVVFVIDDNESDGTLGVIVNRPLEVPVNEVLQGWGGYADAPEVMFSGGPVGAGAGVALGMPRHEETPLGWSPLESAEARDRVPGLGMVDLDTPPEILGDALDRFRGFAGYTGWSVGQLSAEIEEGAWYTLPATSDDVFSNEPGSLWPRVLRRQGGDLALVSTFPDDPTLN